MVHPALLKLSRGRVRVGGVVDGDAFLLCGGEHREDGEGELGDGQGRSPIVVTALGAKAPVFAEEVQANVAVGVNVWVPRRGRQEIDGGGRCGVLGRERNAEFVLLPCEDGPRRPRQRHLFPGKPRDFGISVAVRTIFIIFKPQAFQWFKNYRF